MKPIILTLALALTLTARYALSVTGPVETLAITNLDRLVGKEGVKVASHYEGLDPKFGSASNLTLLPFDKEILTERSGSLQKVTPHYKEYGEIRCGGSLALYLALLEEEIGHPIRAYSDTPKHQKVYR